MRTPLLVVLALVLAALPALPAPGPRGATAARDDEIVREFKKYFRKYKDSATRVEAVLALDGAESPAVVDALVPVLKEPEQDVVRAAVQVLARFKTSPPIEALWAEVARSKDELVRVGLLWAAAEAGYPGGEAVLAECLVDKAWEVRRRAVAALTAAVPRGVEASVVSAVLPLCADKEPAVRGAALDGLARLGSSEVLAPAVVSLDDASWQVRASAIHALARVRRKEAIDPLIRRMALEEGRLVQDIGLALAEITGRDFGQRLDGWQKFWESYGARFEIPTDAELARLRAARAARAEEYKPPGTVTYHGIETPSRSMLFVIDVSGSMENLVVERERFEAGDYPSFKRIDIVKTELERTLAGLESYVRFNVVAFATDVGTWKKSLVPANVLNKSSAQDWVRKLDAIGGASKSDLARAGLTGSANLEAGKTNTFGALMYALGVDDGGAPSTGYQVEVDTIFFLSDGRPSTGKYVDVQDILREVRTANLLRKIAIHAIAIGEFQKDFMESLARENTGVFVDLGR